MNENKENNFEDRKMLPIIDYQGRKFMCLPNRTEITFPDGTVYRVSSTFVGKTEMGDMLATQLNAEGVPTPRTFYYMATGRENIRSKSPYWNDTTVKSILRNEVYLGHMVQNKTGTVSYKNHKQITKPQSE